MMGAADGSPGTGKTLTAKTIAERAGQLLYLVTRGNIGTEPEAAAKYLQSVLSLSRTWDCTVLLDEAEGFLRQRSLNDPKPNALFSVFLLGSSSRSRTAWARSTMPSSRACSWPCTTKSWTGDGGGRRGATYLNLLKSLGSGDINYDDVEFYVSELAEYAINGHEIRK
ncbi:hypothetical protein DL771_008876 [Monosporascus sp. 5C6A]|nr:hypothetical protein DL771_008876 [Monosporascus sp. 5C6A]